MRHGLRMMMLLIVSSSAPARGGSSSSRSTGALVEAFVLNQSETFAHSKTAFERCAS